MGSLLLLWSGVARFRDSAPDQDAAYTNYANIRNVSRVGNDVDIPWAWEMCAGVHEGGDVGSATRCRAALSGDPFSRLQAYFHGSSTEYGIQYVPTAG